MAEFISEEIIEEDGRKYKITKYDTATVKEIYTDPSEIPEPPLPEISEEEEAILEAHANTEYLVALSELSA
jgi:hypothetical protein